MLEIENGYRNASQNFPKIKNYIYKGQGNIEDFGILKSNKLDSVYIIQDREEKTLAYRIYKGFQKEYFHKLKDAILLQKLYENSYHIQNIDFPYGLVTKNNRIIGQAIPYYENSLPLANWKEERNIPSLLTEAYSLIKELQDNHIYYLDIHEYNFMITPQGMKLIDFDDEMTCFFSKTEGLNDLYERHMVASFKRMSRTLLGYDYNLWNIDTAHTMEELGEELSFLNNQGKIKIKK